MTSQPGEATPPEQVCFVIGPIGPPNSDTRKHADQLLHHIIEPAAAASGFSALRADGINSSGIISSEIITLPRDAAMVVADLSFGNGNAFYELAIRHLLRRPFVHMIREGDDIPFDAFANRAVRFDLANLDSAEHARKQLRGVNGAETGKASEDVETPFSTALGLLSLEATTPAEGGIAEVAKALVRLEINFGARLAGIETNLASIRPPQQLLSSEPPLLRPISAKDATDRLLESVLKILAPSAAEPDGSDPESPR